MSAAGSSSDFARRVAAVGERVRARREELGLSQIDLANKVGRDRRTIQQIEYGRATSPSPDGGYRPSNPQLDTMWVLAEALGVDVLYLLEPLRTQPPPE